jgi:hypothetical protein
MKKIIIFIIIIISLLSCKINNITGEFYLKDGQTICFNGNIEFLQKTILIYNRDNGSDYIIRYSDIKSYILLKHNHRIKE